MPRIAMNSRRSRTSCSLIALATVLVVGATPARAQSFLGTGDIVTNTGGSAGIVNNVPGATTVTLNPGNTVINWAPDNAAGTGNMLFQDVNTTATFNSSGSFAVLNNINAPVSRAVVMNGTVNGFVNGSQGGSIYFYAPGGFVFGGTSAFNVGSLVVSALPISNASFAGAGSNGFGTVSFGQASNPNATISMAGTVNASVTPPLGFPAPIDSSYVAMIAPRVVHTGAITVNGSAALVAAEAATINFSPDGLFDIEVTVGSTDSQGLNVTGDIGGSTPTGSGDKQGIYLVAVPKNDAMTMLMTVGNGADLGFTLANAAVDDNGVVVLSAGHDIVDGAIGARSAGHGADAAANIRFTGAHATNNTVAEATGYAEFYSVGGQPITVFNNDLTVHALTDIDVTSSGIGTSLTVGGNLNLSTNILGTAGQSVTAGTIDLYALDSGLVSVAGSTTLTANATGGAGGDATGGNVRVTADDGGSLSLLGVIGGVNINANGIGGSGGDGTGGDIRIRASDGSTLNNVSILNANANGTGGNAGSGTAGIGTGGYVSLTATGDSTLTTHLVEVNADGRGGHSTATGANGGDGYGGEVWVFAEDTGSTMTLGSLVASADARGGDATGLSCLGCSGSGGSGFAGDINLYANTSASLTVNLTTFLTTYGGAGNAAGTAVATDGYGGSTAAYVGNNASLTLNGNVSLYSNGFGGTQLSGTGTGGMGFAGDSSLSGVAGSTGGGLLTVNGNLLLAADGFGAGSNVALGGDGFGGLAQIFSAGNHHFVINGTATMRAVGEGGGVSGSAGGDGYGGTAGINAPAPEVDISGTLTVDAGGLGGAGDVGGDGYGGLARIISGNDVALSDANVSAHGTGETGDSGNGGDGFGGTVLVNANGGDLAINHLSASAEGSGGASDLSAATTGDGFGGDVTIQALANGSLSITGNLLAAADGFGGGNFGFGTNTGSGTGGSVFLQSFGANALVTIGGSAELSANGESGAFCGECGGGGLGGDGFGGSVTVQALGANTASLTIAGSLDAEADGRGGDALVGNGGDGEGGSVDVSANDGANLHVSGILSASAEGVGGYSYGPGDGGVGTGGEVTVAVAGGGIMEIDGGGYIDVNGYGGGAGESATGSGGDGVGGLAGIFANGGMLDIGGDLFVSANGNGGSAQVGDGGDGFGGRTRAVANDGSIHITGDLTMTATATGGSGANGGDATGVVSPPENVGLPPAAFVWAQESSAELRVDGLTDIDVSATGGDGFGGDGGNASAGDIDIASRHGDVLLGDVIGNADAFGGAGGYGGGNGGNAFGGGIDVNWAIDDTAGLGGLISLETVALSASGTGGAGGEGLFVPEGLGGTGGTGGNGTGGSVSYVGSAGGGTLDVGSTTIAVNGVGGSGGNGGSGDTGGNGGAGGNASGGRIQAGTISNAASTTPGGSATYTFLSAAVNASGGVGGDGGEGVNGTGLGGDGGDAVGGTNSFLVRGVAVTADTVNLYANASGGDGGFGSVNGDGGNAATGFVSVESKDRFGHPTQRGLLTADTITGTAIAQGGDGATDGTSTVRGGSFFRVLNGDADIGSLSFTFAGDLYDGTTLYEGTTGPNYIQAQDGTATIGTFNYSTTGELAIYTTGTGAMYVDDLTLSAGNFIDHPTLAGPETRGTIFATSASITTGADFIADADFNIGGNLTIAAPGLIDAHHFTVAGNLSLSAAAGGIDVESLTTTGSTTLLANGNIQTSTIGAGTSVFGRANGTFTAPNVSAGTFIDIRSGGAMTLANLTAGDYIDLRSNSPILIQNASSGETINLQTLGTLTTGNLTAGDSVLGQAVGAINVGTVSAGLVDPSTAEGAEYRVSLASDSNITTQAITAAGEIGFGTPQNLVTGNLDAGGGIMALVGGNITLPTVHSDSYVFLADYSMAELGGEFENFDRSAVLSADPVLTGGSIGISGPLTAGTFVTAAAGTTLTTSTIDAGGDVNLLANDAINLSTVNAGFFRADVFDGTFTSGNIVSEADIRIFADDGVTAGNLSAGLPAGESSKALRIDTNGSVVVGNMIAVGGIDVTADGSVTGQNVTTGDVLITEANGAISYGNISAGLVNPQPGTEPVSVGLDSATSISVGNVSAAESVGFITSGTLTAGDVTTGADLLGLVHGNMTIGDIDADGRVLLADSSMFTDAGGTIGNFGDDEVDIESFFTETPVATGGSITVGAVGADTFTAAAGTSLAVGNMNVTNDLSLDAGAALTVGDLVVGDFVLANGDSISTGSIDADSVAMESTGGNITIGGDITASGLVELDAFGNILTDNITAGTIGLYAGGSITTDNLTTELPLMVAAADFQGMPDVDPDGQGNIVLIAGGNILTGDITAAESILLVTPGNITGQTIEAGNVFMALAHGDMVFGNATAVEVFLADFAMYSEGGGGLTATCVGNCGTLGPDGDVTAPPGGTTYFFVSTENGVDGAGQLPGVGGTNGSLYQTSVFTASEGDPLNFFFNYVTSDGSGFADYAWAALLTSSLEQVAILFTARTQPDGTIVPGFNLPGVEATLTPSSVPIIDGATDWSALGSDSGDCFGPGCGSTGWIGSAYTIADAGNYVLQFGVTNWDDTGLQTGMAFSGITIGGVPVESGLLSTGGSITIGNVNADKMTAAAGTTLTTGIIDVTDFANLVSGGNMATGAITADNNLWADAGGTMTLGVLAGGDIELTSGGNMSFVSANADDDFDFASGGSVSGGNVVADDRLGGSAGGSVTLGNLTAGLPEGDDFGIGISAVGNITVQNASAQGNVGFATQGNLQTGNLSAGDVVLTMVGGNTTVNGTITTTGELGQVYMGDDSMFTAAGGAFAGEDDFEPGLVLGQVPVPTGGSITLNGTVTTGLFQAAAGTTLTTQALNAEDAYAFAGGLAVINGAWDVGDAKIISNDIDITTTGSIAADGDIALVSKNATQTVVGDGTGLAGYNLSQLEFGKLSANDVTVIADTSEGAAPTMVIGNLNVNAAGFPGGVDYEFLTGNSETETASGSIRVNGNVVFNGMTTGEHSANFGTALFELDASTGSISLFSSGTTLGGELGLYADRIHVASATILNKLAANPTYSGYQQELNQAATVQRPEGVLRADTLWIESDNIQSILIQNTGTSGTPAGFLVREAYVNEDEEVAGPPGSINLVVNGQVQTEGGTLTGVEARDALIDEETDTTPFTSNSTINGCPLSGPCIIQPPKPPPSGDVVDDQIDLINDNPLGDGDFGNETDIDDGEEGGDEGASSPIAPPQPLFDTRPLTPGSEVNDPVSGTGNPALLGSEQCEEDENGECPAQPANGDGQ